eukprot:gene15174-15316_t
MQGIDKSFAGIAALKSAWLEIGKAEVHALVGQNGAGKSTLIKILTGYYRRDAGSIRFEGTAFDVASPQAAQAGGISTIYQEINLVPYRSVAENICLGREKRRYGLLDWAAMHEDARALLSHFNIDIDVRQPLMNFNTATQQMIAITVRTAAMGDLSQLDLVATMLGRDVAQVARHATAFGARDFAPDQNVPQTALLTVNSLSAGRKVLDVSFDIRRGEIVGLAGLLGAGRTETARVLFGDLQAEGGTMHVEGAQFAPREPAQAIAAGLGFCSEDRKLEGIIPDMSVAENLTLVLLPHLSKAGIVDEASTADIVAKFIQRLGIKCTDGLSVLMISSELEEVIEGADRVFVLREGRSVAELSHHNLMSQMVKTGTISSPIRISDFLARHGTLIVLLLLIAFNLVKTPNFATWQAVNVNLTQVATIIIVAVGMTLVIATGGIDLSVGSLMAISGALAPLIFLGKIVHIGEIHVAVAIAMIVSILMAGLFGWFNGWLITHFRIQPIIATLVLFIAGRGIAQVATNGNLQAFRVPEFQFIGLTRVYGIPAQVIIMLCLVAAASWIMHRTLFGRQIIAVGGNERAARLCGMPVSRTKRWVYFISGLCAGIAGLVVIAINSSSDANLVGQGMELDAIAAVAVGGTSLSGGRASVIGTWSALPSWPMVFPMLPLWS